MLRYLNILLMVSDIWLLELNLLTFLVGLSTYGCLNASTLPPFLDDGGVCSLGVKHIS